MTDRNVVVAEVTAKRTLIGKMWPQICSQRTRQAVCSKDPSFLLVLLTVRQAVLLVWRRSFSPAPTVETAQIQSMQKNPNHL